MPKQEATVQEIPKHPLGKSKVCRPCRNTEENLSEEEKYSFIRIIYKVILKSHRNRLEEDIRIMFYSSRLMGIFFL